MGWRRGGKVVGVSTIAVLQRARGWPRSTPFTLTLVVLLAVTSYWLSHADDPDRILESASTNVHNLTRMPLRSFVMSALILSGGGWLAAAIELMLTAGILERARGSLSMLKVFASGHVIATLITEGGVAAGVALGLLPRHDMRMIDVGISYGMYACAAAALVLLPKWWRLGGGSLIGLSVLIPLVLDPGMTPIGHVVSVLVGLAWWPQLATVRVRPPRSGHRLRVPVQRCA